MPPSSACITICHMKDVMFVLFHLLVTAARLLGPGGRRTIIAENLLLKHQLLVHGRSRKRAPNHSVMVRALFGFWTLFLSPQRIVRAVIIIKPSTLLRFHGALKQRKYRLLYSAQKRGKPGPKGPSKEIIAALVEMKLRNPRFGCPRIAQQINLAFGLNLNKDDVRRILAQNYRPNRCDGRPSWLTTLGHAKDSLWSLDLFRCESMLLKSHWILVVMDQYTRRIIGYGVCAGDVDGPALYRVFNDATSKQGSPGYLSSDNDPLFQYHRWWANTRVLEIEEIKSVPHVPLSHPFVERLIGSLRRELMDQVFFWTSTDLQRKLSDYQTYFNRHRTHSPLEGNTQDDCAHRNIAELSNVHWQTHCRGLFQLPSAA